MRIVVHQNYYATPAKPTRVLVLHLVGVGDNRIGMGSNHQYWIQLLLRVERHTGHERRVQRLLLGIYKPLRAVTWRLRHE